MEDKLIQLKKIALDLVSNAKDNKELKDIEVKFLWRKWELTEVLKWLSTLSKDQIPVIWKLSNQVKIEILNSIEEKSKEIEKSYFASLKQSEWIDVSQPGIGRPEIGHRHPISKFIEDLVDIFSRMWFSLAQWEEIQSEWYNFTALNLGADHPAREMQDTFFIKDLRAPNNDNVIDDRDDWLVLRTQTSSVQIHYMQGSKPPISVIAPWKTFRKDSDATHSPMFHQCEWLLVDKNVSLSHLKFVLLTALRQILEDPSLDLRFRLSYFPFTEPSLELDVTCPICWWKDSVCKVCKWYNWLEIWWCWMVHPNVLKNWWIDPDIFNWFAFWIWIDRLVMVKHRINDLRLFFENDLRFLRQF